MNGNQRFDLPCTLPVKEKKFESKTTATLTFVLPEERSLVVKPGQYFMLWLPGEDEIPISVSKIDGRVLSFTVCSLGPTSSGLVGLEHGALVGLRGPFGNGFSTDHSKNVLITAGGMGVAPLRYLIYHFIGNNAGKRNIFLIQGAKTKNELFFRDEFEKLPIKMEACTDDGSLGFHGFPSTILEDFLAEQVRESKETEWEIYACGPERMLEAVLKIASSYQLEKNIQISLADRYIRCGFGICGSCFLDDLGLSICKEGPVFRGDVLQKVKDFGKYGRAADGSKYQL